MNYFESQRISESTTAITSINDVRCFLIEGEREAILIDTGVGIGDLREYVSGLSAKPLRAVLLTHGHCDHAGGVSGFENVYLNQADMNLVGIHTARDMRMGYIRNVMKDGWQEEMVQDILPSYRGKYEDLRDGMRFSLGNVTLRTLALKGHTPGMMCVLNEEERWLLLGDACNTFTFMFDAYASSIEEYHKTLISFKNEYGSLFDTVYLSHGPLAFEPSLIDENIELCEEILKKEDDGVPFSFMGKDGYRIAKAVKNYQRIDGKNGNIVYNPNNIRKDRNHV